MSMVNHSNPLTLDDPPGFATQQSTILPSTSTVAPPADAATTSTSATTEDGVAPRDIPRESQKEITKEELTPMEESPKEVTTPHSRPHDGNSTGVGGNDGVVTFDDWDETVVREDNVRDVVSRQYASSPSDGMRGSSGLVAQQPIFLSSNPREDDDESMREWRGIMTLKENATSRVTELETAASLVRKQFEGEGEGVPCAGVLRDMVRREGQGRNANDGNKSSREVLECLGELLKMEKKVKTLKSREMQEITNNMVVGSALESVEFRMREGKAIRGCYPRPPNPNEFEVAMRKVNEMMSATTSSLPSEWNHVMDERVRTLELQVIADQLARARRAVEYGYEGGTVGETLGNRGGSGGGRSVRDSGLPEELNYFSQQQQHRRHRMMQQTEHGPMASHPQQSHRAAQRNFDGNHERDQQLHEEYSQIHTRRSNHPLNQNCQRPPKHQTRNGREKGPNTYDIPPLSSFGIDDVAISGGGEASGETFACGGSLASKAIHAQRLSQELPPVCHECSSRRSDRDENRPPVKPSDGTADGTSQQRTSRRAHNSSRHSTRRHRQHLQQEPNVCDLSPFAQNAVAVGWRFLHNFNTVRKNVSYVSRLFFQLEVGEHTLEPVKKPFHYLDMWITAAKTVVEGAPANASNSNPDRGTAARKEKRIQLLCGSVKLPLSPSGSPLMPTVSDSLLCMSEKEFPKAKGVNVQETGAIARGTMSGNNTSATSTTSTRRFFLRYRIDEELSVLAHLNSNLLKSDLSRRRGWR